MIDFIKEKINIIIEKIHNSFISIKKKDEDNFFHDNDFMISFVFFFLFLIIMFFASLITGCATKCEPKTKIIYKTIEKPCPKLQTININDLNISEDKEIKATIKVK